MSVDLESIRVRIDRHPNWYHQIELAPGLVTPGTHKSQGALGILDGMGLPRVCTGLRVLDIGCRDGFFAFELERRGATVIGLDYADPGITGFGIAADILGSQVEYRVENVYDLDPQRHGLFDLVLFLGVVYHLRNPMLALDRVRSVTKPGALVFVETQILAAPAVADLDLPLWQFVVRNSLYAVDDTTKWIPNVAGLKRVLEECQLEVLEVVTGDDRAVVKTRGVADSHLEYYRKVDASAGIHGRSDPPVD